MRKARGRRQRARFAHQLGQALAFDELEHQIERAVLQLTEVTGGHHVRMLDATRGDRFTLEARDDLGEGGHLLVQDLDRHGLAHVHVLGAIDRAHAATADQCFDSVAPGKQGAKQSIALSRLFVVARAHGLVFWKALHRESRTTASACLSLRGEAHYRWNLQLIPRCRTIFSPASRPRA